MRTCGQTLSIRGKFGGGHLHLSESGGSWNSLARNPTKTQWALGQWEPISREEEQQRKVASNLCWPPPMCSWVHPHVYTLTNHPTNIFLTQIVRYDEIDMNGKDNCVTIVVYTHNQSCWRLRQEGHELKPSLGYFVLKSKQASEQKVQCCVNPSSQRAALHTRVGAETFQWHRREQSWPGEGVKLNLLHSHSDYPAPSQIPLPSSKTLLWLIVFFSITTILQSRVQEGLSLEGEESSTVE